MDTDECMEGIGGRGEGKCVGLSRRGVLLDGQVDGWMDGAGRLGWVGLGLGVWAGGWLVGLDVSVRREWNGRARGV